MSNDEIVRDLIKTYKAGDTGIYHDNWFMVKLSDEVRAEFDKRIRESWFGIRYGMLWIYRTQLRLDLNPVTTENPDIAMQFETSEAAKKFAVETLKLSESKFSIEQFFDC